MGFFLLVLIKSKLFRYKLKCTEKVEDFVGNIKIRDVQRKLCRDIYQEARQLTVSGDVAFGQRDLFLEQGQCYLRRN